MTCHGLTATLSSLNDEWAALTASTPRLPVSWRLACPLLADADLATALDRVRSEPDAVLLALLSLQRAGDALAGRTVVQALVPKLVLMASRDAAATFDDYLAALWVRVATYPISRRPRRVAANLALDTLKSVKSTDRTPPPGLPTAVEADPLSDAASVLDAGVRLGAIDALTRRTLEVVYLDGRTSASAGVALGLTADAVRWRCSKGVRALRSVVPELVDQLAG